MIRRNSRVWMAIVAVLLAASRGWAGDVPGTQPVSGIYDEQATQNNRVDYTATGSSLSVGRFSARVAEAYRRDFGGVIDAEGSGQGSWTLSSFGTKNKKVLNLGRGFVSTGTPGTQAKPISGSAAFLATSASGSTVFFESITGGSRGEAVVEAAVTVLSRTGVNFGAVSVKADLDNGTSLSATRTISDANGSGDTFYGFSAPAGQHIKSLTVAHASATGSSIWFDDIGFRTAVVAPERVDIAPKINAMAREQPGGSYTIETNEGAVTVAAPMAGLQNEFRGILEFDISALQAGSSISTARLELNFDSHSTNPAPRFSIIGYAGDGLVTASDITKAGPIIGSATIDSSDADHPIEFLLDPAYIESLAGKTKYLGMLLTTAGDRASATFRGSDFDGRGPRLTIDYNPLPEPAGGLLVGMGMFLVMRRR